MPAGVLRANVAMDEDTGGFDAGLLTEVFADRDEVPAAVAAGAGFGFLPVLDPQPLGRQGMATAAFRRTTPPDRRLHPFPLDNDRRAVLVAALDEAVTPSGGQGLSLWTPNRIRW